MNCESLIFDIDGTLWDSRALMAEGYNIQLRAEGHEDLCTNAEVLKTLFGKVMTELADAMLAPIPAPERYALMDRCMASEQEYLESNPCDVGYPGIREIMEKLSQSHRLFIVSNGRKGYPQQCIEKLGMEDFFTGHLCFGDTGTSKGQTIRKLMADHNIRSAAYIGDTQGDLEATREAGIPFVFAAYGFGNLEAWEAKADCPQDLLEIFG